MCRTADRVSDGYWTSADLPGELGKQPHGPQHHVVEVVGPGQEGLDRPPLGHRQRLDTRQPVHEQPVPLVGGDAAGAGVRLGDVALLLEDGHVVADRRRRHVEVVPVHQGLRADGFHGGDVVADDGAQDRELPVVQHLPTSLALHHPECQFYGGLGPKGTVAGTPACRSAGQVPDHGVGEQAAPPGEHHPSLLVCLPLGQPVRHGRPRGAGSGLVEFASPDSPPKGG